MKLFSENMAPKINKKSINLVIPKTYLRENLFGLAN